MNKVIKTKLFNDCVLKLSRAMGTLAATEVLVHDEKAKDYIREAVEKGDLAIKYLMDLFFDKEK